jgi:hypothetical protein
VIKKFSLTGVEETTYWGIPFDGGYTPHSDIPNGLFVDQSGVFVVGWGNGLAGSSSNQDWWVIKFNK